MKKLFLFALAALTFSCSSDDAPEINNPDQTTTGIAYMRGKMNNVDFDYTVYNSPTDAYVYSGVGGYAGLDSKKWYRYGGGVSTFSPPNFSPSLSIAWENAYYTSGEVQNLENQEFYNTVNNLPNNYLSYEQEGAHMPGISVQFKDANGEFYNSVYGSQSGSTLIITGSTEEVSLGQKIKTIWGTFSCKVYKDDNPSVMVQITNGTFKIMLVPNN